MDRTEQIALVGAGLLMALFLASLVYAAVRLNISVPTCVTDVAPFRQGQIIDKGNQHYEVHMVAKMWAFDPPEVRLPPGSDVDIYLSAADVIHGMYIEHTNVNLMAVPGSVNTARVRFEQEGEYPVICHEYCGAGHQFMMGKFVIARGTVVAAAAPRRAKGGTAEALGEQLFQQKGCGACHSTDGSASVGPTVKGILGKTVVLEDGSRRTADEAYLAEVIRNPNRLILKDYPPVMPSVPLTDQEVEALVEYLESLS
jgi:cytochrome c oxidase subunit II